MGHSGHSAESAFRFEPNESPSDRTLSVDWLALLPTESEVQGSFPPKIRVFAFFKYNRTGFFQSAPHDANPHLEGYYGIKCHDSPYTLYLCLVYFMVKITNSK